MWGAKFSNRIVMQSCTGVDIRDVVTPANFGSHRFRRFRMAEGRISGFSIDFQRRPYNTLALPCQRVIVLSVVQFQVIHIIINKHQITITSIIYLHIWLYWWTFARQHTMDLVAESWAKSFPSNALLIGAKIVSFWSSGTSFIVPAGARSRSPTWAGDASIVPENSLPANNSSSHSFASLRLHHLLQNWAFNF